MHSWKVHVNQRKSLKNKPIINQIEFPTTQIVVLKRKGIETENKSRELGDVVFRVAALSVKDDSVSQASWFKWSFAHPLGSDPEETKSLSQGIITKLNKV